MAHDRPDPNREHDDDPDAALEGPPPREATYLHSDREREAEEERAQYTSVGPELSGGDPDAALGIPEAPDDEVRMSSEILDERDRHRAGQEATPAE